MRHTHCTVYMYGGTYKPIHLESTRAGEITTALKFHLGLSWTLRQKHIYNGSYTELLLNITNCISHEFVHIKRRTYKTLQFYTGVLRG